MGTRLASLGNFVFEQSMSVHYARAKFRHLLLCTKLDMTHVDFVMVGFSELCQQMRSKRGVLEFFSQNASLKLKSSVDIMSGDSLSIFFDIKADPNIGIMYQLELPGLSEIDDEQLSAIINFKNRDELFLELESNQINMEKDLMGLVADYSKKRSKIFGRTGHGSGR